MREFEPIQIVCGLIAVVGVERDEELRLVHLAYYSSCYNL